MKHAADADQAWPQRPIQQKMPGSPDKALGGSRAFAAVAQMPASDIRPKLGEGDAAGSIRFRRDIAQGGDQQPLIPPACCVSEAVLAPSEDSYNVGLGRFGQAVRGHRY